MIRVLQFADIVNRYDFIDNIVRFADPAQFELGVCVRSADCNIANPAYEGGHSYWVLNGAGRLQMPQAAWQLARILRRWNADILHVHHYDQAVVGWAATRLYRKARLVVGRHYSDAIYRLPRGLKRQGLLAVERTFNRACDRIVVPSTYIVEILTRRQGVNPDKIDHVPYGFVPQKYAAVSESDAQQLREELGLNGRFVLGTFARLHEEKGHRYLLDALKELRGRFPELLVLLVGEGPQRQAIENQVESAGLTDMVRLLGWRRDAMPLMAAVDAVVQPTLQEAFSQSMVEALWMGKPLVMTDVSGATDIIHDGQNGLLVPKANSQALAQAIERLAGDLKLGQQLGQAGKTYVEQNLTIDRIIPRYEQVYSRAMAA